jgi:hypothetical protein
MSRDSEKASTIAKGLRVTLLLFGALGLLGAIGCALFKHQGPGSDRPTIRVRNGSVDITVDAGDFQPSGTEWYSDAGGREPTQFRVTLTGTSCDGTTTTTQPVVTVTYALASSPLRESFEIRLKHTGTENRAFVTPLPGVASRGRQGQVRIRFGQPWALHQVTVGNGAPCTMTQAKPEIDIAQVQ